MSHWAMRRCSSRRHSVCGWPAGLAPRRCGGRSATAASKSRCAPPPRSRCSRCSRRAAVVSGPIVFLLPAADSPPARHLDDLDRRLQLLAVRPGRLNLLDHVHALDDPAEGGEALAVRVALAAEVQLRLVADADEEV